MPSNLAGGVKVLQLPLGYLEGLNRYRYRGHVGTAGDSLTITTMAFQHEQRLRGTLVSDIPTNAAASEWYFHSTLHTIVCVLLPDGPSQA